MTSSTYAARRIVATFAYQRFNSHAGACRECQRVLATTGIPRVLKVQLCEVGRETFTWWLLSEELAAQLVHLPHGTLEEQRRLGSR